MRAMPSAIVAALAVATATIPAVAGHADEPEDNGALVLLLDSSGSMKEPTGGGTRIEAAKDALTQVVDRLPDEAQVGIRVFGATVENRSMKGACTDTQNVVPVGPLDRDALKRAVADYQPYGETPIGSALQGAAKDLGSASGDTPRTIVLLSDGEPNCKPDPCPVARRLANEGINLKINVVGLNVDATARRALQCIAKAGKGEYVDATSADELAAGLVRSSVRDLRAFKLTGERVTGGNTIADALPLRAGVYLDRALPDDGKRHYLIDKPEGGGIGLSALVRTSRDNANWNTVLRIGLQTPEGDTCDSAYSQSFQVLGLTPITTTGLVFNQFRTAVNHEMCMAADQLVATVLNESGPVDYQLKVTTYPAITNADALPEPLENGKGPWVANVHFPKGAPAQTVVGGVSPEQAPELTPGTTYTDTVRPSEQLVYKVPVGYGQALRVSALIEPDERADHRLGIQGQAVDLYAVGPTGERVPRAFDRGAQVDGGGFYNGADPTLLTSALVPVRARNNASHNGEVRASALDGHAWVILGMGAMVNPEDGEFSAPVRLRAELVGEASGQPEYDGRVQPASTSPSPQADSTPTEPAGDDDSEPTDSNNWLLIGGLSLGAALIGGLAYLVGRRGRP